MDGLNSGKNLKECMRIEIQTPSQFTTKGKEENQHIIPNIPANDIKMSNIYEIIAVFNR